MGWKLRTLFSPDFSVYIGTGRSSCRNATTGHFDTQSKPAIATSDPLLQQEVRFRKDTASDSITLPDLPYQATGRTHLPSPRKDERLSWPAQTDQKACW